jgi:hypothetical protein
MPPLSSGREAVIRASAEEALWLPIIRGCYEFARESGNHFSGKWISNKVGGWFPGLRRLVTLGILEKEYSNASGRKAYYRVKDLDGVGSALHELGVL